MSNVSEAPATARIYSDPASVVAYSPNGEFFAIGYMSIRVEIYRHGELLSTFDLASHQDKIRPTERVRGLAFNEDGSLLFVAASDKLFALDGNGRIAWTYEPPRSFGFLIISPTTVSALAGRVVAAFDNGSMAAFDEQGNIQRLWKDNETPRKLQMTRGGVVVGSDSFSLCGWAADSGARLFRHKLSQRVFAFSASWDGELAVMRTLWEAIVVEPTTNKTLRAISVDPSGPVVAMEPSGARIALSTSCGWELHNTLSGTSLGKEETPSPATSLAFNAAGTDLLVGLADGSRLIVTL